MRMCFVTSVQGGLSRVKCRVKYVHNFTQANFALEGDRVKTGSLLIYLPVNVVVKLLVINVPNMFTESGICPPFHMCERSIMSIDSIFEILSSSSIKYT